MQDVTTDELLAAVGVQLRAARERAGYATPWTLYRALHRPAVNTIEDIEAGRARTLAALDDYCAALQLALPDVLRQVLTPDGLDADAHSIGKLYQTTTDPDIRAGLRAMRSLTQRALTPAPSAAVPIAPPAVIAAPKPSTRKARTRP